MRRIEDAEYIDILYDVKHAPFDEILNSAEGFNSVLVTPMFDKLAAINVAKEVWAKEKGEVHVYEERWEDDHLAARKLVFRKANDGEEYDEAKIKRAMGRDSSVRDVIKKTSEGYIVFSEKGKKLSKAYATKKEAEARLAQIEMFKKMKKDAKSYKGYEIKAAKDHYEILKGGKLESTADTYSEAIDDIDCLVEEKKTTSQNIQTAKANGKPKKSKRNKYRVWYVLNSDDELSMHTDVYAESADQARKKVKAMRGNMIYGYPHDAYLIKDKGENMKKAIHGKSINEAKIETKSVFDRLAKDSAEEAKRWLMKYLVKKGDPGNKTGKTHIRHLRENENLPKGVYHKASMNTFGILHFKNADYYWKIEGDDLKVEEHKLSKDSDKRFSCYSYFDKRSRVLDTSIGENDFKKAKKWAFDKKMQGCSPLIVDNRSGDVFDFEEELEDLGEENEMIHLWLVSWHNKNGVKHQAEFDSEEDAKDFMENIKGSAGFFDVKITEKNEYLEDALPEVKKDTISSKIKSILLSYLLKNGFSEEDFDDYVGIHFKQEDYEGDKSVKVTISNDLGIDYYDLPQKTQDALDDLLGIVEPYAAYVWEAWMPGVLKGSAKDSKKRGDKGEYHFYRNAKIYEAGDGKWYIEGFGEPYENLRKAKKGVDEWIEEYGIHFEDSEKRAPGKRKSINRR